MASGAELTERILPSPEDALNAPAGDTQLTGALLDGLPGLARGDDAVPVEKG